MPFVRVKSAREGDPRHEFDISTLELEANPDLYEVVDDVPVNDSRVPIYVTPEVAEPKPGGYPKKGRA